MNLDNMFPCERMSLVLILNRDTDKIGVKHQSSNQYLKVFWSKKTKYG